jgi:hypothetical protein
MSKKLLFLFVIAALLIPGAVVFADQVPATENVVIENGTGALRTTPTTVIIKVRNSKKTGGSVAHAAANKITSCDAVAWDTTSSDGVSVVKLIASNKYAFAGIAVTDIATSDSATLDANDKSWGYIAIRGFALASIDAAVTAGQRLVPADTGGLSTAANSVLSFDVGVCLGTVSSAGDYRVYLK